MKGVAKKRGDMAAKVIRPTHKPQVPALRDAGTTQAPGDNGRAQAPLPLAREARREPEVAEHQRSQEPIGFLLEEIALRGGSRGHFDTPAYYRDRV